MSDQPQHFHDNEQMAHSPKPCPDCTKKDRELRASADNIAELEACVAELKNGLGVPEMEEELERGREALELGKKIVAARLVYLYEDDDEGQGLIFEGDAGYSDIEDIQSRFRVIIEREGEG